MLIGLAVGFIIIRRASGKASPMSSVRYYPKGDEFEEDLFGEANASSLLSDICGFIFRQ